MRLIDADKLIEDIKQEIDIRYMYSPKGFINVVNLQPTAFDVDKVCEQLQENSVMMGTSKCAFDCPPDEKYIEEVVKFRTALEIVERGGIGE